MEELLNNNYISAIIVFMSQIVFLFFRTLNVIYNSQQRIIPTLITGIIMGLAWLVNIGLGLKAFMGFDLLTIFGYLLGGTIGT